MTVAGPLKENRPGGLDMAGGKRVKSGNLASWNGWLVEGAKGRIS